MGLVEVGLVGLNVFPVIVGNVVMGCFVLFVDDGTLVLGTAIIAETPLVSVTSTCRG